MATVFRTTATLPDATGRYRTSIVLATRLYGGTWSEAACKEHCERQGLPTRAYTISDEEWELLESLPHRCGYVDAPGDTESAFVPEDWRMMH